MRIEQNCILIFDDKEEIPFQREIYDAHSNQYLAFPLSLENVGLVSLISRNRQSQLKKKISQMKKVIQFIKNGEDLQKTVKMKDYLPDIAFGPKSLQINKGEAGFQRFYIKEQQQKNMAQPQNFNQELDNSGSNVSILIYKGETIQQLKEKMNQYNIYKIKPIVVINGKSAFKQLMNSDMNLFFEFYQNNYFPFHQKFFTSNHHSLYFQLKDEIGYYFVFAREFDKFDLIQWIYQGILKFIQPKFAVIQSSNEKFDKTINILQLFAILEEENKYFGIQCLKKINFQGSCWYNFQGDFAEIALKLDSMFKIKQFHDPLSCIYKWSSIEDEIDAYINILSREYLTNGWAFEYNTILPKLMYKNHNLELKILTKQILKQQFSKNEFKIAFNQFCEFNQNINYQQRKCRFGQCRNVFQWFISKVLAFYNYFGISICFFFSFQCPYSILYNLFGNSAINKALAIILPLFYGVNVLLLLLLVQLYHFNDKFIEKDQNQEFKIMVTKNEEIFEFQTEVQSKKVDVLLLTKDQEEQNLIICEIQQDDYSKDSTYILNKQQLKQQEFFFYYYFPNLQYISHSMVILIKTQNILDVGVAISILSNLIIIHGWIFLNERTLKEAILFIMVIIVIIFHFLNKGIGIFKMTFQFSTLTYIWQFFQLPKKITSATQRIEQKKQLGIQLFLNLILLYSFIAIESYYDYSGYILIGIFGYLSIIYFIIGFFQFIQNICNHIILPKNYEQLIQEVQVEEGDLILEDNNNQDLKDILSKNLRKIVAETNEGQENQLQKLTDTIKFQLNDTFQQTEQKMNEEDVKNINQIMEEQIKKYFSDKLVQSQQVKKQININHQMIQTSKLNDFQIGQDKK